MNRILTEPILTNEGQRAQGLDAYITTRGEAISGTLDESLRMNPTALLARSVNRQQYYPSIDEFGNEIPAATPSTMLTAEKANAEYGIPGKLSFDQDTPEPIVEELHRLKREELAVQDAQARSPGGVGQAFGQLGVGFLAGAIDPLNIASAFIPVVGEARMALWAERFGVTGARFARGGLEGAIGAAAVEPLVYGLAQSEQADYSAVDSVLNIAFGTMLGAGLHTGLGKLGDFIAERQLDEPMLRSAIADIMSDQPVEIRPLIDNAFLMNTQEFDTFRARAFETPKETNPRVASTIDNIAALKEDRIVEPDLRTETELASAQESLTKAQADLAAVQGTLLEKDIADILAEAEGTVKPAERKAKAYEALASCEAVR